MEVYHFWGLVRNTNPAEIKYVQHAIIQNYTLFGLKLSGPFAYDALTSVQQQQQSRCNYSDSFTCDLKHGASSTGSMSH